MSLLQDLHGLLPVAPGLTLADLQTPIPLIDVTIAERNLRRWQQRCATLRIANRPHIKTHKATAWARTQIALGAVGITCQTLGEAEAMANAGVHDITISFNLIGQSKLDRFAALARRIRVSTVADSAAVVAGLATISAGAPIDVMVECDGGLNRCGVKTPEDAASLAKLIADQPALNFAGLFAYPGAGMRPSAAAFMTQARALCESRNLQVSMISLGGTPDLASDAGMEVATEYRAGTYIYNDRSLIARGACNRDDVAITVLGTVISHVSPQRAILDTGSKALTSDLLGLEGYGAVDGMPDATLVHLDEEHGYLDLPDHANALAVGDRVRIIPNHACVVSNLYERVAVVENGSLIGFLPIDARGR